MHHRVWMSSFVAVGLLAGVVVACGDDDNDVTTTPKPDAGFVPGTDAGPSTPTDGSTPRPDSGSNPDTGAPPAAPITPLSTTRIPNAINPYGIVFGSDGKLYASGATVEGGTRYLAVWRFTSAGAIDTTFGEGGKMWLSASPIPGGAVSSFDLAEVSPGNFVVHAVTGGTGGRVWLVKLTKDAGAETFSWGTPKMVAFDWADGDAAAWPAVDGGPASPTYNTSWGFAVDKVTTAGTTKLVVFASGAPARGTGRVDNDRWVARVNADTLDPDPGFNSGAAVSFDGDNARLGDNARRGIILPDGTIISGGYANFGQNAIVLGKLTAAGALDTTFGFGTDGGTPIGQAKMNPFLGASGGAECYAVVRQSNGRLVTTGYGSTNTPTTSRSVDMLVVGAKADALDTTFGTLGATTFQSEDDKTAGLGAVPWRDRGRDVAVLPDDRIVVAGVYDEFGTVFILDKDGKADKSVGVNGILQYNYPANFFRVVASPDGKTIAVAAESAALPGADAAQPLASLLVLLKVGQ